MTGKFKVGDRVVPIDKTNRTKGLETSSNWMKNGGKEQGYLYVSRVANDYYSCSANKHGAGDFFAEEDLISYEGCNVIAPKEKTVLQEAESLIYGDREQDYGSATKNFSNIAAMWSVILGKEITIEQVVQCMIALKQCRLINQPDHKDSWVDICGYAGVWEKIKKGL